MTVQTDISRPVMKPEEDRYGFTAIAEGLARSISMLDMNVSTVIGIEGKWGAGKSSLLHLLIPQLRCRIPAQTQIVEFSPWLHSPDESPINAFLVSVAAKLARLDTSIQGQGSRMAHLVTDLLNYARQTSRGLAPLTRFASKFLPQMELLADGMDALAATDLDRREKTAAELRTEIERQMLALDVNIVVMIDDLDRLEPAHALEILRMVRSVADFPGFQYVMCYDRDVLAHAVETGLGVQDGALYLQKIIPLSFSLPRPESYDLRREFEDGALAFWREVNEGEPDEELCTLLADFTAVYGEALSTPREVNQALNGVRFRYPGLRDYVCYPDLCLIQLLATVKPALVAWAEHYLTEWSIVVNRDGRVRESEQNALKTRLLETLGSFGPYRANSTWELPHWLPGISGFDEKTLRLFETMSAGDLERASSRRRLASPVYWRYYFSFSAPQNVMSDADIQDIITLADKDYPALEQRLLASMTSNGISSRTWLEHILTRLTPAVTDRAGPRAQLNLLRFLFRCSDRIITYYCQRDFLFRLGELGIDELASQLILQIKQSRPAMAMCWLSKLFREARAFAWATLYLRSFSTQPGEGPVSREELSDLQLMMKVRLADKDIRQAQIGLPFLNSFVYAWREIVDPQVVSDWLSGKGLDDREFLNMLLNLRTGVSCSSRGYYRCLNIDRLHDVFGVIGLEERLEKIRGLNEASLRSTLDVVDEAIRLNND
ncbi:KAP family P-loop NTPase fold protein [Enterobacter hormaechei]|nr:pilA-like protein [Enterobacter hormaechei]